VNLLISDLQGFRLLQPPESLEIAEGKSHP
jgi:hypothetical protein